jgi:[ribosomal protein S5]-alanine N-acetyltransferase
VSHRRLGSADLLINDYERITLPSATARDRHLQGDTSSRSSPAYWRFSYACQMQLKTERCLLRPFTTGDPERLAEIANDRRISKNLTDQFPYPYTTQEADEWIELASGQQPVRNFAIGVDGSLVGGIGVEPMSGEKQHVAAVGYWLTPTTWGKGLATEALSAMIDYVQGIFPHIRRLQASVYDWNPASGRVLEKCGFDREATLRGAIVKDGDVTDEHIYVRTLE